MISTNKLAKTREYVKFPKSSRDKNLAKIKIKIDKTYPEFILKNIDRSYEKVNLFTNLVDNLSLTKGKAINLSLIKKVLKELKFWNE